MKIGYINGLRGLAILMVIWEHWYSRSFEAHAPAFLDPLVSAGNYGVEIFFVLSGFVLYLPYCNGRPFVARTYLVHRARRLLPLFYVALFASAALHRDNPFPYALLLYPNPQSIGPIFNFPLWSISAEIWFSALLPVLIYLMRWPIAPYLLIAASLSCALGPEWLQRALPGTLYLFVTGMLVAANLRRVRGSILCLPLAVAAAYLPVQFGRPAAGLAAAGIIFYCWHHSTSPLTRALNNNLLQVLGIMCFSIYVWHEPVRNITSGYNAFSPIQLANWTLLGIVAVLSYRFIERGADRPWERLLPRPRPPHAPATTPGPSGRPRPADPSLAPFREPGRDVRTASSRRS